jgi:hypothetical protein
MCLALKHIIEVYIVRGVVEELLKNIVESDVRNCKHSLQSYIQWRRENVIQEVKYYRALEISETKFKNKNEPNCCNLIHFLATI